MAYILINLSKACYSSSLYKYDDAVNMEKSSLKIYVQEYVSINFYLKNAAGGTHRIMVGQEKVMFSTECADWDKSKKPWNQHL